MHRVCTLSSPSDKEDEVCLYAKAKIHIVSANRQLTISMIKTKKDLKFYLKEDAKRNGYTSYLKYLAGVIIGGEQARVYRFIKCLRYGEYHLNNNTNLYHRLLYYYFDLKKHYLGAKYNIVIHYNSTGYGLRILHLSGGGGVALGFKSCGNYCGFNSGVMIGVSGDNNGRPVLGDHVGFGPGAKAFGDITIGSHVFVAPNVVVTKNIPDHSVAFMPPARIATNT